MLLMHDVRKKTIWQMVGEWLRRIDIPMLLGLLTLMGGSLLILRSAGSSDEGILMRQTLRFAAAFGVLLAIVAVPGIGSVILALLIIAVPGLLILMEPDLGTALLVSASGFITLFLAGMPRWIMLVGGALAAIALPLFWMFGIKDYQRDRVLTLFNPEADPFGNGYHIIQSKIAIGSGGLFGKGYMQGTQSQLEFLPESSTDFIFAVIAEETGLIGVGVLLICYGLIIARGLYLALHLSDRFARIMVASILLTLFINVFVNIGMVSGILPVVGLPLAMISYGGSSILSLMAGFALAMNLAGGFRENQDEEHL